MNVPFEAVDFVFAKLEDGLDEEKLFRKFRLEFQNEEWMVGFGKPEFTRMFNAINDNFKSPLKYAAHRLLRLENKIVGELLIVITDITPTDANHTRDLLTCISDFQNQRLDLTIAVDRTMKVLEDSQVSLDPELLLEIERCWPKEIEDDE